MCSFAQLVFRRQETVPLKIEEAISSSAAVADESHRNGAAANSSSDDETPLIARVAVKQETKQHAKPDSDDDSDDEMPLAQRLKKVLRCDT